MPATGAQGGRGRWPRVRRDVEAARRAGLADGEITAAVAGVALNIYTNYLNHVRATASSSPAEIMKPAAIA